MFSRLFSRVGLGVLATSAMMTAVVAQSQVPLQSKPHGAPVPPAQRLERKSGPVDGTPIDPSVGYLATDLIESKIDARDNDVLMVLYAPWCGACSMTKPIIYGVSNTMRERFETENMKSLEPSCCSVESDAPTSRFTSKHQTRNNKLDVLMMDDSQNHLPGFLNEKESEALPLIKFFPKCGSSKFPESTRNQPSCKPVVFEGHTNVESVINFIYKQMDAQPSSSPKLPPFDLDLAHTIAKADEPTTHNAVGVALKARIESETADTPALRIHELAPCGNIMADIIHRMMSQGYRSYTSKESNDAEESALFSEYRVCLKVSEESISNFWYDVREQAEQAIATIETNKNLEKSAKAENKTR